MALRLQRPGLRGAILGSFILALALILGALFFLVPAQIERDMVARLDARGRSEAVHLARELAGEATPAEQSQRLEHLVSGSLDVEFAALVRPDGTLAARATRPDGEDVVEEAGRWRGAGRPDTLDTTHGRAYAAPMPASPGLAPGHVLVGISHGGVDETSARVRLIFLIAFVVGLVMFALLVWLISRTFVLRPLESMMSVARQLSEADLTGRLDTAAVGGAGPEDELGRLGEALNRIGQNLRETLTRVRGVSEGVAGVVEQLSRTGTTVSSGAGAIQGRVEETSSSMVEMMASLRGIAENVEVLYASAEESSSSIMEMAATNDQVAENVQAMAASVEETTSAIEEMTYSIKEVAKNIEELYASTEETSSSINQMDNSIEQVEGNAYETARLSEQVSEDAQTGVESLRKTLSGIDRIKETSRTAAGVIESLGKRISDIGNILNVIDDVAEQTNLLALNAAIIAAQAGEHGKGFAVVAEEIKDLAERTGASTKEIAELIGSVQEESRNAVSVMNQGVRIVEEGVRLGREAEGALQKINDSAQKATQMVKAIARATVEQSRGSKQVTGAIHRISDTVQQISKASNEQAKGGEQIMKSAERMKALTQHVQKSAQEQAHGSRQISRSIENINEMVTHLNRAQKEQTKGSEQVLKAVEAIKGVCEHQMKTVRQLEEAIDSLQRQAEVLRAEVRRFRV